MQTPYRQMNMDKLNSQISTVRLINVGLLLLKLLIAVALQLGTVDPTILTVLQGVLTISRFLGIQAEKHLVERRKQSESERS